MKFEHSWGHEIMNQHFGRLSHVIQGVETWFTSPILCLNEPMTPLKEFRHYVAAHGTKDNGNTIH